MKLENHISEIDSLQNLTPEELLYLNGGGFWEDLGYLVGSAARAMYENSKRNPSTVHSVGPGVAI